MKTNDRTKLLNLLSEVVELSPDVRVGQLLANLGFLVEARSGASVWEVQDRDLLKVIEQHRDELVLRQQTSSTP